MRLEGKGCEREGVGGGFTCVACCPLTVYFGSASDRFIHCMYRMATTHSPASRKHSSSPKSFWLKRTRSHFARCRFWSRCRFLACIAPSARTACRGKVPASGTGAMTSGIIPGLMSPARFAESGVIVAAPAATALVNTTVILVQPLHRLPPLQMNPSVNRLRNLNLFRIFNRGHSRQR